MIMMKVCSLSETLIKFSSNYLEAQVYEILDAVGEELEYEDVQQLLEKFEYDSEKIIDHILKNKGFLHFFLFLSIN